MLENNIQISPADSAAAAQHDEVDPAPHILVVDDEPDLRRLNAEILTAVGYKVESAPDGEAAWQMIQDQHFTLLITDNRMPKMSGLDLIKKLQAAGKLLPVILTTGSQLPVESIHSLQIEVVLLKPYSADELLAKTRNVLQAMNNGV